MQKTPLRSEPDCGTIPVEDGYVLCPVCYPVRRSKLLRIGADTTARRLELYCRHCKHRLLVNIDRGQSTRCQSPKS